MQPVSEIGNGRSVSLVLLPALLMTLGSAHAILFYSTGDPNFNTTAPSGALTNSGWQYEGSWGGYLGTAIAPKYFITAHHVGGGVGQTFGFRGVSYTTVGVTNDPASDLSLWRICGTFPDHAQIYTDTNEVGQSGVVIGRGTQRGVPVTTTNILGIVKTHGWRWGSYDGVARWGENALTGVVDGDSFFGSGLGELLQAAFDANGGSNECHLSFADSGGALFLKEGSVWKLAGINYAVDGPYNTTGADPGFDAAIFDGTGLYEKDVAGLWVPANGPGSFYVTRVSAHASWINSVLNVNVAADPPILQSSTSPDFLEHTDEINATVDDASKTIIVALPGGSRYYRLRACDSLRINSIQVLNGNLVLRYQ